MSVTVVTGWNDAGYVEYGKTFLESFDRHWPADVRVIVYAQSREHAPSERCVYRDRRLCAGIGDFLDRNAEVPLYNGLKPDATWSAREVAAGYNFRFDAVKFAWQIFQPEHAAWHLHDGDVMVWLDGDVVTDADVPSGFVEGLLGDADLCHLGREGVHSEIGFWAVRINYRTRWFLREMADHYRTDRVFKLREWHSAFVFDHVRDALQKGGSKVVNLTPGGKGHVFVQSPLGRYMDHLKGPRKAAGASPERRAAAAR